MTKNIIINKYNISGNIIPIRFPKKNRVFKNYNLFISKAVDDIPKLFSQLLNDYGK